MLFTEIDKLMEEKQMLTDLVQMQTAKIDELMYKVDEQAQMIADYESLLSKLNGYVKTLKACIDEQQPRKTLYKVVNVDENN